MIVGVKSMTTLLIGQILILGSIILFTAGFDELISFLTIILIFNYFLCFFLFNIFIVKTNSITIKYLLNPFKQSNTIQFSDIERVNIVRRTVQGGTTSFKFTLKNKRLIIVSTLFLKMEEEKFKDELMKNNIIVDIIKA